MPLYPDEVRELDVSKIRDISGEVLDADGRLRILPAAYWASVSKDERALFANRYGYYSLPTVELVEHLREVIGKETAVEIGAGSGILAAELGIRATDRKQQEDKRFADTYGTTGGRMPPAPYGPNVETCTGNRAARLYRPDVILACWVTHRYNRARHAAGGNAVGVDEEDLLRHVGRYVFVGNELVHKDKSIWSLPHTIDYPPWLYSRAVNKSRNFIAIWPGSRKQVAKPTNVRAPRPGAKPLRRKR